MKRGDISHVKGTTSTIAGIGFPAIHSFQSQFKIAQNPFDTYVTMDKEKVSFYSDVIKEKIKIIHIADTHLFMDDIHDKGAISKLQ